MATTSNRRTSAGTNQTLPSRHPLALACAAAFLIAASASHAQEAATTTAPQTDEEKAAAEAARRRGEPVKELETVKVTGIRRGIENAIETKQASTSIVESISSEDIGKLPDASIAESIARLPGLTAQRERGRAVQINIRGFAGDFAGTTLNGREQTTAGDNRGVEFDQYPSELLSSVVVYKTPDASLIGQGLSGTVDMRTVRPLDFADRVVSGNFRFDQNESNGIKTNGNRYSFAYIDQFSDDRVGIAIGYAHLDNPNSGFQNEAWGYPSGSLASNTSAGVIGGGKAYKFDTNVERDGWMATLQLKPNDFYESSLDVFYSKFRKTETKTGVEFGTVWAGQSLSPTSGVVQGNTATTTTWTNVKPVIRSDSNPVNDEQLSVGWNNKFRFDNNWEVTADASYSKTNHKFRVLETYAGLAAGVTSDLTVEYNPSEGLNDYFFSVDLNDPTNLRLVDAGGWGQDGYVKDFSVVDKLTAFRIDAERSFDSGFISSIQFGYNRSDRSKSKYSDERKLCIVACAGGDSAPFPGSAGGFGFSGIDGLAFFDANSLLQSGFYNEVAKLHSDISNKNWSVDETMDTLFAQANIDTDIGEMPLRGNFGFQYVMVDQSSSGFSTFQGDLAAPPEEIEAGATSEEFLPSLNLSLEVIPDGFVRFAAARQMARPRMDDMRATFNLQINNTGCGNRQGPLYCANSGNPALEPWLANAYDLSLEKYFTTEAGNKGYFAAAYFFKDLQTYIYKQDVEVDFAGLDLPAPGGGGTAPATTVGILNLPANGEGGTLKGLELTASIPFDMLWAPLNGFGLQATYSDTKSSISPNGPGTSEPLPGLSKYVSSATLYYEKSGFSVRYSQRTRSAFRAETRGFGADLSYVNIRGEKVQDAQVNYTFPDSSSLKGLGLYLQVSNIGDEPFSTYDTADPDYRPITYFGYGRTTLLGFSYKF